MTKTESRDPLKLCRKCNDLKPSSAFTYEGEDDNPFCQGCFVALEQAYLNRFERPNHALRKLREALMERDDGKCHICGKPVDEGFSR